MVDEHAITFISHIKRHAFVCLLTACAAVGVVNIHNLPVLDKVGKPLTKAVDAFVHIQIKLLAEIRIFFIIENIRRMSEATAR